MKYYLVAGERSGDLHGSNLVEALSKLDEEAGFKGIGGELMRAAGMDLVIDYSELAFMGFWEVFKNLLTIKKYLTKVKKDILAFEPDALILIDYPGFNLRLAKFAKKNGFKVFYYISPKIWAWNTKRVYNVKKSVDRVFCILPFEKDFYQKYGVEVDYVGNPVVDAIKNHQQDEEFALSNGLNPEKTIAVLPGSRKQEVRSYTSEIKETAREMKDFTFAVSVVSNLPRSLYAELENEPNIKLIEGNTYDLLMNSNAAIVTSGTATLETAILNVPQVVCYKMSPITYSIAKRVIKVPFISLVNLIMDKEVVTELIQNELTVENLASHLIEVSSDSAERRQMIQEYEQLRITLGTSNVSNTTASKMYRLVMAG
ncbi:MAG: lipid-A-disaccharide synthase [Cyclobacteriaceae bacterium]